MSTERPGTCWFIHHCEGGQTTAVNHMVFQPHWLYWYFKHSVERATRPEMWCSKWLGFLYHCCWLINSFIFKNKCFSIFLKGFITFLIIEFKDNKMRQKVRRWQQKTSIINIVHMIKESKPLQWVDRFYDSLDRHKYCL